MIPQLRDANDSVRRMQASSDELKQQLNNSPPELDHLRSARALGNDMAVEDWERTPADANSLRRHCRQLENRLARWTDGFDLELPDVLVVSTVQHDQQSLRLEMYKYHRLLIRFHHYKR